MQNCLGVVCFIVFGNIYLDNYFVTIPCVLYKAVFDYTFAVFLCINSIFYTHTHRLP